MLNYYSIKKAFLTLTPVEMDVRIPSEQCINLKYTRTLTHTAEKMTKVHVGGMDVVALIWTSHC